MAANPSRKGYEYETRALDYLKRHGLELIARNYRCKLGELDLIMRDGNLLTVVEVRYRRNTMFGSPAETVDRTKQRKIARATLHFLQRYPKYTDDGLRFDVVEISGHTGENTINWIQDAFGDPF